MTEAFNDAYKNSLSLINFFLCNLYSSKFSNQLFHRFFTLDFLFASTLNAGAFCAGRIHAQHAMFYTIPIPLTVMHNGCK